LLLVAAAALAIATVSCAAEPDQGPVASPEEAAPPITPDPISAAELAAHTRELASDAYQGRGPAGPGEAPTLRYLQGAYARIGLLPAGNDVPPGATRASSAYLQEVGLLSITADPATANLAFVGSTGAAAMELRYGPDFVTWTTTPTPTVDVSGNLVFVGYGVNAPEERWNDYGGLDMTGKVALMLVNDPPLPDASRFGGPAMTYYGRWTYKYEEAARQGAAGAILIHTTESAGYGWQVVESSWSGEQLHVPLSPESTPPTPLQGWITREVAERLFDAADLDFTALAADAGREGFEPVDLGLIAAGHLDNTTQTVTSYNVVGAAAGSDPRLADEYIIYTAHWDHLGIGAPVDGDAIYNGAMDNATGVAGLLEIAAAWTSDASRPRRSALFIATTAEESGLLGSAYYVENPLVPLDKTLAVINLDVLNVWGPTEDLIVVGLGNSTLDDVLTEALAGQGRVVGPDPEPEKGFFYRSDHFPFARAGVPALYVDYGTRFVGRPPEFGQQVRDDYTENRYHQPADEFDQSWDFSGAALDLEALLAVGVAVSAADAWPEWKPGTEFKATREAMLAGRR
jgi:Zn-dependent M28 family amino/carboxypeptidase